MHLLLCAATKFEIDPTLKFIGKHPELKDQLEVLVTGVGLTAATYQLTKRILSHKPGLVLQAGICGSLNYSLIPGEIVVVKNENIGDLGVMEKGNFNSLFNLGFIEMNEYPWTKGKLSNLESILRKTGLKIVDGVTINEITTNADRIVFYQEKLNADIETKEGAALHYVCLSEKIPFLQLRSVSNFVGERDKSKWELEEAISSLNLELQKQLIKIFKL